MLSGHSLSTLLSYLKGGCGAFLFSVECFIILSKVRVQKNPNEREREREGRVGGQQRKGKD